MKRLAFLTICLFLTSTAILAQSLGVYISDNKGPVTNVRKSPGGTVLYTLPTSDTYIATVANPTKGWWQVKQVSDAENDKDVKGFVAGGWIHHSLLVLDTRNYGGERWCLRKSPSAKAKATYTFSKEISLHPIDIKGNWVKVKTADGKHEGWIESYKLCDSPLTNCC